ncbi:MAG: BMP family ABC transporter substrate-binding protein [Treponema sp.]
MKKITHIIAAVCMSLAVISCSGKKAQQLSVAVFIPGIIADSPIYAMLADGVKRAVNFYNKGKPDTVQAGLNILEAGTNQAEWSSKLTALAAEGKYSVIISSNPSLPELVEPLTQQFPSQKFILLDAYKPGNNNIATVRYNQHEQSYLTGYMAALVSKSHKIGLITAQEYPVMNNVILPGYKEGALAAAAGTTVDLRIVGNWYDASKASELANAMYKSGVDVILPICGGAAQGVINAAKENGKYLALFDNASFDKAPYNIISCTTLDQKKMADEITAVYLAGKTEWGTAKTVGVADGYVNFEQDAPENKNPVVSDDIRIKMKKLVESIRTGKLILPQN